MNILGLFRGLPGHPLHPSLTDGAIGAYAAATALACLGAAGVAEEAGPGLVDRGPRRPRLRRARRAHRARRLALHQPGTPLWWTATTHAAVMVLATALVALAAVLGYAGYVDRTVDTAPLVLVLLGFVTLAVGGWVGGSIVFAHGMRVLNLPDEPAVRAIASGGEEKAQAEA